MDDDRTRQMRNVLAYAMLDEEITEAERDYIRNLRDRLEIDHETFREIVQQVRENPKRFAVPSDPSQAQEAINRLAEVAAADSEITGQQRDVLRKIGERFKVPQGAVDEIINQALAGSPRKQEEIEKLVEEIYAHYNEWDDAIRQQKIDAIGEYGQASVLPLLRVMESYRTPDGMDDAFDLKERIAAKLGSIGDTRAVYYLVQQVNVGDIDDEVSNQELRAAAAQALGDITENDFPQGQEGIEAVRRWWMVTGHNVYDSLAF